MDAAVEVKGLAMFTTDERAAIQEGLIGRAERDPAIVGAALVGSAATGRQDAWSDIDLMLQLAPGVDADAVSAAWTDHLAEQLGTAHTLDVIAPGGILYRVFLLPSSLQVDISFWPYEQFRATAPGFALLFGEPNEPAYPGEPDREPLIGMAWLYALHVRSAIARDRPWQAALMLDGVRGEVVALACLRHGLPAHSGRGVDQLPADVLDALAETLPRSLSAAELGRVKSALLDLLLTEIRLVDPVLADALAGPIGVLAENEAGPDIPARHEPGRGGRRTSADRAGREGGGR